ncbi:MAG: hypothetical protein ACPHZ7_13380, partial [Vibrio toranzoniae]
MLKVHTRYQQHENHRGTGDWPSWRQSSTTTIKSVERVDEEADRYENIFDADAEEGTIAYV